MENFKWYSIPNTNYLISSLGSLKIDGQIIKGNYNRKERTYKLRLSHDKNPKIYFASELIKYGIDNSYNILPATDKRKQPKGEEYKKQVSQTMKAKKGYKYLCLGILYDNKFEAAKALNCHYQTIHYKAINNIKGFSRVLKTEY